jgi:hypothetical protein
VRGVARLYTSMPNITAHASRREPRQLGDFVLGCFRSSSLFQVWPQAPQKKATIVFGPWMVVSTRMKPTR